jgi:hypothetical protein
LAAFVALLAALGLLLGLIAIERMRHDLQVVEAAERLEKVDLSYVVQKYIPIGQRSQKANQEIPLIREAISIRRPCSRRMAILSGVLLLSTAAPVALYLRHLDIWKEALRGQRPSVREYVDALTAIQGVWGWKADAARSCEQNAQTVAVSADRKTVSIDYAKPHEPLGPLVFAVISTAPNTIVMKHLDNSFTVNVNFFDANAYVMSFDQFPMASTGSIERCSVSPAATGLKWSGINGSDTASSVLPVSVWYNGMRRDGIRIPDFRATATVWGGLCLEQRRLHLRNRLD